MRSKSLDLRHFFLVCNVFYSRLLLLLIIKIVRYKNENEYNLFIFRTSTTDKESHSCHSTTDIISHESVTSDQCNQGPSSRVSTVNPLLDAEPCPTRVSERVLDSHSVIASGDFGKVVKLKGTIEYNLTDMDKYKLLTEHYIPTSSYPFPARTIGGTVRHFQHSWFTKYPGLVSH